MDEPIKRLTSLPLYVTDDNKFDVDGLWDEFTSEGRCLFNFMYEFMERNPDDIFATDLFKLGGFTNEQIVHIQKILNAGKYNSAILAAQFVSNVFGY